MRTSTVKVTTSFPGWPLASQTPARSGAWGGVRAVVDGPLRACDLWVVYEDLRVAESATCPPGRVVLITGEPPSVKSYPPAFLDQFDAVITCHDAPGHAGVMKTQQALPWHVIGGGAWDFDRLCSATEPDKPHALSVMTSSKTMTPEHRQRLAFVRALAERMGEELHVFGRGINEVAEKWDAIAPYRYHVVIENCAQPDYWSEKLADAFLCGSHPFYYGCPNIGDYFEADALTPIDITDVDGSAALIRRTIRERRFERSRAARERARQLVLHRYNLFAVIEELDRRLEPRGRARSTTLHPERTFRGPLRMRLARRLRNHVKVALGRWSR